MADESLDALLTGDDRLSPLADEVADSFREIAAAGKLARGKLRSVARRADDAGDELADVSREALGAAVAVTVLDDTLSGLDGKDVDVGIDVDSARLSEIVDPDIDFTRQVRLSVNDEALRGGLEQIDRIDGREVKLNPVLRDLRAQLNDATQEVDRTITTRTDNDLAAAAAQDALGDVGVEAERIPDEIDISVDADGVASTRGALEDVRRHLSDLDGERASVTIDVDRSALSDLDGHSTLDDLDVRRQIELDYSDLRTLDVDGFDDETIRIATDMDVRGSLAHLEAVERALDDVDGRTATADVDVDVDRSGLSDLDDRLVFDESAVDVRRRIDVGADYTDLRPPDTGRFELDDETIRIATDMDVAGSLAHIESVERALDNVDGRTATADVDVDTDIDRSPLHRAAMGLGGVSIPVDFDLRDRAPDLLFGRGGGRGGVEQSVTQTEQIDVSLGDSERRVVGDIAEIRAALLTLPDDRTTSINTEADLDELLRSIDSHDQLPREVHTQLDVDAKTADAHAALGAVFAEAKSLDDLDVDIDVDTDTNALNVLRRGSGGGRGFDFDLPDFGSDRRGPADSFGRGVGAVGQSFAKLTRTSGAIGALKGLGPVGSAGAGLTATVGVSLITAGVSGALGTVIGGAGLGAGLALPVFLNTDEREIADLKRSIKESLDPLRGGEWDQLADEFTAEIPDLTGEFATAIDGSQPSIENFADRFLGSINANQGEIGDALSYSIDELSPEFGDISTGTLESLPGIIRGTTDSARGLLSFIDDAARASGPLVDNLVTLGEGSGDILGPSTVGALETLSMLSIPLGSAGEFLGMLGSGMQKLGDFEDAVFSAGERISVLRALGGGPLIKDKVIGGDVGGALETLQDVSDILNDFEDYTINLEGGGFFSILRALDGGSLVKGSILPEGWETELEGLANGFVGTYNRLNNNPLARFLIPGMGKQDLKKVDLTVAADAAGVGGSGGGGGGGGGGGDRLDRGPSIQSSAVASLPSMAGGASTTAGGGSASSTTAGTGTAMAATAQPLSSAGGGKTINNNQTFQNEFNFYGVESPDSPRDANRTFRRARKRLNREQAKMSGPGN